MPLFGHKNKNHNNTTGDHLAGGGRHDQFNNGGVTGLPRDETIGSRYPQTGTGASGAFNDEHAYGNTAGTMPPQHGATGAGAGGFTNHGGVNPMSTTANNDPYLGGQQGLGGAGGRHNNAAGVPPAQFVNHDANGRNTTTGGGTGTRMTGKVESAVGTMVGSSALKAKGLQKEQEANAVKAQTRELQEAERLEHEAMMRRERAVAHGAHPANGQLGAGIN